MPTIYKNTTDYSHTVSDLNITFAPKSGKGLKHMHTLDEDVIKGSMGMQILIAKKILKEVQPEDIPAEAAKYARSYDHYDVEVVNASEEIASFSIENHASDAMDEDIEALGDVIEQ